MEQGDVYAVLRTILQKVEGSPVVWRLDGSANLRVQGVDVLVRDLDIKTNRFGWGVFKECLKEYFVKEYSQEEILGDVAEFLVDGFPVVVIHNRYSMLHRIKKITFQGISLPVLPLREARELYAALGQEKTVMVIDRHLG